MKYPQLRESIHELTSIEDQQWEEFEACFEKQDFEKSEFIERPGELPKHIYLVVKGVLRIYYVDPNGREFTKVFRGPGELIGHYAEILQNYKTRAYIQAVSDGTYLRFSYSDFAKMMDKYPAWQILGRKIAENNYCEKERREYMLMQMSTEEKYQEYLQLFSAYRDEIPQYQAASYMGITPEALSRLLRKSSDT